MILILTDEEVEASTAVAQAVEVLRQVHRDLWDGRAIEPERLTLFFHEGASNMRVLAAAIPSIDALGYKAFHKVRDGVRYLVSLIELSTGRPLAMMDANRLTILRTGTTAALATSLMMPEGRRIGVVGSGHEARMQVEATCALLPVEEIRVFSPRAERRQAFKEHFAGRVPAEVVVCDHPREVVGPSDVLVVATNTKGRGVAFEGAWLQGRDNERLHVSSIGSTLHNQREIDEATFAAASEIVLDTATTLDESGDGVAAQKAGVLKGKPIRTLGELCARDEPRTDWAGVTLYKSVGSALQDIGLARLIFDEATERGIGTAIPDFLDAKAL